MCVQVPGTWEQSVDWDMLDGELGFVDAIEDMDMEFVDASQGLVGDGDSEFWFIISASNMDIQTRLRYGADVFKVMVDFGANISLGPKRLAKALGCAIIPYTEGRTENWYCEFWRLYRDSLVDLSERVVAVSSRGSLRWGRTAIKMGSRCSMLDLAI